MNRSSRSLPNAVRPALLKASIIIPVRDGLPRIRDCVRACLDQVTDWPFEIALVDSGSSDGTLAFLQSIAAADARVVLHRIPSAEFGHGRTRNHGALLARGEFLCFLTQDAVPADSDWLSQLVGAFADHPTAAGAFGRHRAHLGHPAELARRLYTFFDGFGGPVTVFRIESEERYRQSPGYRRSLRFFSDNNSCLRRSVWEKLPFDDVSFGEDQLWAEKILRHGYAKLYVDRAVVRHSHDFGPLAAFRRAREEAAFYRRCFDEVLVARQREVPRRIARAVRTEFRVTRAAAGLRTALRRSAGSVLRNFAEIQGAYLGGFSPSSIKTPPAPKWTGERLETFIFNQNTAEHLHRYALAVALAPGRRVLDIASGEGYGSHLLAEAAVSTVGVDIDALTVRPAAAKYLRPNLTYLQSSADAMPAADASFDLVVSFETLEHHDRHEEMMREVRRVLAPGGWLLMSSPDKSNYFAGNPHHVKELRRDEFVALVSGHFKNVRMFSQSYGEASYIVAENKPTGGDLAVITGDYRQLRRRSFHETAVYNLCLAGDGELPSIESSMFENREFTRHQEDLKIAAVRESYERSVSYRLGRLLTLPLRTLKTALR